MLIGSRLSPPLSKEAKGYLQAAFGAIFGALLIALALLGYVIATQAEEHHSNSWLSSWIPATCCVTNNCCWEIAERELRPLPNDEWEVRSTGQIRKRTGWSPDGKFYRCACEFDRALRAWVVHEHANTRCIFVPLRGV